MQATIDWVIVSHSVTRKIVTFRIQMRTLKDSLRPVGPKMNTSSLLLV